MTVSKFPDKMGEMQQADLNSLEFSAPYVVEAGKRLVDVWLDVYDHALTESKKRGHDESIAKHAADLALSE